jgi:hypothetical protein
MEAAEERQTWAASHKKEFVVFYIVLMYLIAFALLVFKVVTGANVIGGSPHSNPLNVTVLI